MPGTILILSFLFIFGFASLSPKCCLEGWLLTKGEWLIVCCEGPLCSALLSNLPEKQHSFSTSALAAAAWRDRSFSQVLVSTFSFSEER